MIGFITPEKLADKILAVEREKEGFIDGAIVAIEQSNIPIASKTNTNKDQSLIPAYNIDYQVETTRSKSHFLVKASIYNKNLYIFTIQCPQSSFDQLRSEMKDMLESIAFTES